MANNSRIHLTEDTQLLLRVAMGDHTAFQKVYEKYFPIVSDYISVRIWDKNSHENIVQDVFLRIWQHKRGFCGQSTAKTYIFGITKNVLREHFRRIRRQTAIQKRLGQISSISEPEISREYCELVDAIKLAKSNLSEKQQQAIELVLISDISPAEAAKLAGCSVSTFRRRLCDAKKRLLVLMDRCHPSWQLQHRTC
ncbi:MAG: sigma-70 family RNA polymerase sigma factor [Aliifodinibius sp.]|nr:RNA polymerase sigma factor [Fodinibius sp.]NIV14783.1 sigma-70 family RNA polymerase sigma factor [Fodinibius sp.]NIY28662.1 sigma-70 family RNA polymerase sigma factor [Fodinibius sp.]